MSLSKEVKEKSKKVDVGVYEIPLDMEPHIRMVQTGSASWLCKLCYKVDDKNYMSNLNKETASVLVSNGMKFVR